MTYMVEDLFTRCAYLVQLLFAIFDHIEFFCYPIGVGLHALELLHKGLHLLRKYLAP